MTNHSLFCLADHSNIKEHANSNDAGDKHESSLLADEPSTSLNDVVVGQPDLTPAIVPVPRAVLGTGADVIDSSKVIATMYS